METQMADLIITRKMIADMAPQDLMLALARHGVHEVDLDLLEAFTSCPHCGHVGRVVQDFGVRVLNGVVKPQSWCRDCRSRASTITVRHRGHVAATVSTRRTRR